MACCWKYWVVGELLDGLNMFVWACSIDSKKSVKEVGAFAGVEVLEVVAGVGEDAGAVEVIALAGAGEWRERQSRTTTAGRERLRTRSSTIRYPLVLLVLLPVRRKVGVVEVLLERRDERYGRLGFGGQGGAPAEERGDAYMFEIRDRHIKDILEFL